MSHRNRIAARLARLAAGAVIAGAVSLPALAAGAPVPVPA